MKRLTAIVTCLVGLLAGCERVPSADHPVLGIEAGLPSAPAFARGDLRLVLAHSGLRRLEFAPGAGQGLAYRERIVTDGQGRYSVRAVDALESSTLDWDTFELLHIAREGFFFRYRDFVVRDPRVFARNWRVIDHGQHEVVAGRTCQRYRVERVRGEALAFELSVDAATGLVLASSELDASGQERASMRYEAVDYAPDLAAVVWHQPSNLEQALDLQRPLAGQVNGRPLEPRLLPPGYAPLEAALVGDGQGKRWLKCTYTDGVEPLFFLQAEGLPTQGKASRADGSARPAHPGSTSSVVVFQLGSATVLQGWVDGFELMVIGKAPQAELLDLIESALP